MKKTKPPAIPPVDALLETRAQFARRMGQRMGREIARSTVTRWAEQGRIVGAKGGKIDVAASLARLDQTATGQLRPDVSARHARETRSPISKPTPAEKNAPKRPFSPPADSESNAGEQADDPDDAAIASPDRVRYKALALQAENGLVKLGLALQRGLRFYVSDVKAETHGIGGTLRAALERLIDQTAPRLAIATPAARSQLIEQEIRRVRAIVNREYPRAIRRARTAARGKT